MRKMPRWILLILIICITDYATVVECAINMQEKCFSSLSDGATCRWPLADTTNFNVSLPNDYFGAVCCQEDGLGCFSNTRGTNFECMPLLPECMNKIRPEFYFYTPIVDNGQTKHIRQIIDFFNLDNSLTKLELHGRHKTAVIIHGFGNEWPKPWLVDMTNAFLALGYNVLVVRWTGGSQNYSSFLKYFKAASNARTVGAALAKVLRIMAGHGKLDLPSTTIVGYSLGAHVAGYTGSRLSGIGKIVGLDPAGPLFACQNPAVRLDPSDASLVEIIHTNGDHFFQGGVGTMQQMGHVDLYANGGRIQPGCNKDVQHRSLREKLFFTSLNSNDFWCSHTKAADIFIEFLRHSVNGTFGVEVFPCSNETDWSNGDCVACSSNGKHPKPAHFQLINDFTVPRGKLFFNTLLKQKTGSVFGSHYAVSLMSNVNVTGRILLKIVESQHIFDIIEFQSNESTMIAFKEKRTVVALLSTINVINEIRLTYISFATKITTSWTLLNCTMTNSSGNMYRIESTRQTVHHGIPVSLKLLP